MAAKTLEQKIDRLNAAEDIRNLKAIYCDYCDKNYDPDGLASLFVEDGIWDGGKEFGRHEGRAVIHEFFSGASGSIVFAAHLVMNPLIRVSDDALSATGKWRLIMPCTVMNDAKQAEARWLLSAYDEQYVKVDGDWRYKTMIVDSQFYVTHAGGWAEETAAQS